MANMDFKLNINLITVRVWHRTLANKRKIVNSKKTQAITLNSYFRDIL